MNEEIKFIEVKILVTPDDFKNYNNRLPNSQSELDAYAKKVQVFVEQAISEENRKMCSAITRKTEQTEIEKLQAENKRLREALIKISLWNRYQAIYNENELPDKIAEQALQGKKGGIDEQNKTSD